MAWYTYMRRFMQPEPITPKKKKSTETPTPHANILFFLVVTKQSLKDVGGGAHDAVISIYSFQVVRDVIFIRM